MNILQRAFDFLRDQDRREAVIAITTIVATLGGGVAWVYSTVEGQPEATHSTTPKIEAIPTPPQVSQQPSQSQNAETTNGGTSINANNGSTVSIEIKK